MANISMYKRHGSDEVIVRRKGGPKKDHIKTKPKFAEVRKNNSEWAGCAKMGSKIRVSFKIMNRIEDYAVSGALNALSKQIQKLDTEGDHGKRAIRLSQHKDMLLGFGFSSKQVLESVLRVPIETVLNRVTGEAQVIIPVVDTDMYLYNFRNLPYYRIVANLGGVSDMTISEGNDEYKPTNNGYCDKKYGVYESDWIPTLGLQPAMHIHLTYPLVENPIPDEVTLLLSVGIEFGKKGYGEITQPVKYAGSGKIVRVG